VKYLEAEQSLVKHFSSKLEQNKPLAKLTSLRIGGPARFFLLVDSIHELSLVSRIANQYLLPILVLGRGTNLLVSDKGFPGVVIQLGREFQRIVVESNCITAGAAVTLSSLTQAALRHQLAGLAFAVGIPGTLGAAIAINAGAFGGEMSKVVQQITVFDKNYRISSLGYKQIGFAYRHTSLHPQDIILEARLQLSFAQKQQIRAQMERIFRQRKQSQPLGVPSVGSVFKNPLNESAAKLIESCGCKNWQVGGIKVSDRHANFFVNLGGGTATDFYQLMEKVRRAVFKKFSIELEPEVKLVGEFKETNV
jgi:UDP-N-acetylmuramate dehydrogenase